MFDKFEIADEAGLFIIIIIFYITFFITQALTGRYLLCLLCPLKIKIGN